MSRVLAELLQKPERQVAAAIAKLEDLSSYASEDVRLLAEAKQALRLKVAQLGLDPDDTTAAELYHGAQAKLEADLRHINKTLKSGNLLPRLVDIFNGAPLERRVWALKKPVTREMLQANPPKRLMKALNYRSVESMLKREHPALLLAGGLQTESSAWQKRLWQRLGRVTPADFEDRPLEMVPATAKRWVGLAPRGVFITLVPQLGAAVVWPPNELAARAGAGLVVVMLQAAESLRDYSSCLKLRQFNADFGKYATELWRRGRLNEVPAGPLNLSWRATRRHFARQPDGPAQLGPHLQTADLHVHGLTAVTTQLWPRLAWWVGAEHLALTSPRGPVTLNLADTLHNFISGAPFSGHTSENFKQSLWDKLTSRYLAHPAAEAYAYARVVPADTAEPAPNDQSEPTEYTDTDSADDIKLIAEELQAV